MKCARGECLAWCPCHSYLLNNTKKYGLGGPASQTNNSTRHVHWRMSVCSVLLVWSASANAFAPSSPILLSVIHQQQLNYNHEMCNRAVLSLVSMSFLFAQQHQQIRIGRTCTPNQQFYASRTPEIERLECVVSLECLRQRLRTFGSNVIACHTSAIVGVQ